MTKRIPSHHPTWEKRYTHIAIRTPRDFPTRIPDAPPLSAGLSIIDRRDNAGKFGANISLGGYYPTNRNIRWERENLPRVVSSPVTRTAKSLPTSTPGQITPSLQTSVPGQMIPPTGYYKPQQTLVPSFDPWAASKTLAPTITDVPPILIRPKLDPRILNPPVIEQKKPESVLDVINRLIFPNVPIRGPFQTPPIIPPQKKKEPTMDLGTLISELGGAYITSKFAQPVNNDYGVSPYIPNALEPYLFDSPVVQSDGGCCVASVPPAPKGYHYNRRGCITKNRRRRKRLASASDIKDLSSLKTVLSGAQMNTWIATH